MQEVTKTFDSIWKCVQTNAEAPQMLLRKQQQWGFQSTIILKVRR